MTAQLDTETVWVALLVGLRVTALVFTAPLLSHAAVPIRVRLALATVLTAVFLGNDALPNASLPDNDIAMAMAGAREVAIGAVLGFATGLTFAGIALTGEFMAIQGGLGAANVLDPTSGISSVVLTSMLQVFGLMIFMAIDGHHQVLLALGDSFTALPVAGSGGLAASFEQVVRLGAVVFELAVRLSAPIVVAMLCSNVAVGILGRAIPQLNLIALQLPAHIALTLLLLGLAAGPFTEAISGFFTDATFDARSALWGAG